MSMMARVEIRYGFTDEGRSSVLADRALASPASAGREVWQVMTPGVCRLVTCREELKALVARHPGARLNLLSGRPATTRLS